MKHHSNTYDSEMFIDTFENTFTYIAGFMRNVRRFAERDALTCPVREKTWSYPELNTEVNQLAQALMDSNVGKDDVVRGSLFLQNVEIPESYRIGGEGQGASGAPKKFKKKFEKGGNNGFPGSYL